MPAREEPNDSTCHTNHSTAAAAFVARSSSDRVSGAAIEADREHEQVVSEKALDEALEMTFPASDPLAL